MKKILLIGDVHLAPKQDMSRMTWLGKYIVDEKPEIIVQMGDFGDYPSLSSYDKGKKSYEGRSYAADVKSVIVGQELLLGPLSQYNNSLKKAKTKQYKPRKIMLGGNHDEGRISRAINEDRKLEGVIGIEDQRFADFGWEYSPYKEIINVEGVYLSHHFSRGLLDKPVTGNTATLGGNILKEMKDNAFQGHCHVYSVVNSILPTGRKIWGGSIGCYFEHSVDYVSRKAQDEWARGVLMLNIEDNEIQDLSWISLSTIKREYK